MNFLFNFLAETPQLPVPINPSKTTSPSSEDCLINISNNSCGFSVGCVNFLLGILAQSMTSAIRFSLNKVLPL